MKKLTSLIMLTMCIINVNAFNIYNSSNSGIPGNDLRQIIQDSSGNIWVATSNGLAKFNGNNWFVYNTANSGLSHNNIICLALEDTSIIWIGTLGGGISRFDGHSWRVYNMQNSNIPFNNAHKIVVDNTNKKYLINSTYQGLVEFNDTNWVVYNSSNSGIPDNRGIFDITVDRNNHKWISFSGFLNLSGVAEVIDTVCAFRNNVWDKYTSQTIGVVLGPSKINIDKQNKKWFNGFGGSYIFNDTQWISSPIPRVIDGDSLLIADMAIENGGRIWLRYQNSSQLYYYENGRLERLVLGAGISFSQSQGLARIFIDSKNNKWYNNFSLGLIKYNCSYFDSNSIDTNWICGRDSIELKSKNGYLPNIWFKSGTNNFINTSSSLVLRDTGIYHLYVNNLDGCSNDMPFVYSIDNRFDVSIINSDSIECLRGNSFDIKSVISDGDSNSVQYNWSYKGANSSNINVNFDKAGVYDIQLIAKSRGGCLDTASLQLIVLPNPTAGPMLGETNALSIATPYIYTVAQQPNHTYNWVVTNGIIAAGQGTNAVTVQWLANGKGSLKAEVNNTQGCSDTTLTQVTIGNVGLNEAGNINSLMVYPNPSNGAFTVSLNALKSSTVQMSLINLLGQEIWSEQLVIKAGEQNISVQANLSPGMYTLHLAGQEDQIQQKVIIK